MMTSKTSSTLYSLETETGLAARRLLVAEDDTRMRDLLVKALRRDGFEITEARNGAELLDWIADLHLHPRNGLPIDLIITDIRMPKLSGLDVLTELRRADWAVPVIVITAFGDDAIHTEARRLGAAAVFDKPFDLDDIRVAVSHFAGAAARTPSGSFAPARSPAPSR